MYDIIINVTKSCNYKCTYCNVIKNSSKIINNKNNRDIIKKFLFLNKDKIGQIRFFGGEPILNFYLIKGIINDTNDILGKNFDLVTNTSLLNKEHFFYFKKYFKQVFFSIDSENYFDSERILNLISEYNIKNKIWFNVIIDPDNLEKSFGIFFHLYDLGIRRFNILPVYYTKKASDGKILFFSKNMKKILDITLIDKNLELFGFQENLGHHSSLIYNALFIDTNFDLYYTDLITLELGEKFKKNLYLGNIVNKYNIGNIDHTYFNENIIKYEKKLSDKVIGQNKLHKVMDYFSHYLNNI